MADRAQLHEMLDRVPDSALPALHGLLAILIPDPLEASLRTAPLDDEEETEEERLAVEEAREDYRTGRFATLEEVRKELGL